MNGERVQYVGTFEGLISSILTGSFPLPHIVSTPTSHRDTQMNDLSEQMAAAPRVWPVMVPSSLSFVASTPQEPPPGL